MDHNEYLKRIGFIGEIKIDHETLSELQYRHYTSVPYENIDILNNIPLSLDLNDLYEKVVIRKRGGFCFELNALYNELLVKLGFNTTNFFARFLLDEPEIPMRRHRIMRVDIDGEYYIADVGVGSVVPERSLKLVENDVTEIRGVQYKFIKDDFLGWVLMYKYISGNKDWRELYSFTEEPQIEVDFVQPNFFCQYHDDSIFNKVNMIAVRTEAGKYTLDDCLFKEIDFTGKKLIEKECDPTEIPGIMEKYFGITFN